jgi:hypothetical protein
MKCEHPKTRLEVELNMKVLDFKKCDSENWYMCYCPKCNHFRNFHFFSDGDMWEEKLDQGMERKMRTIFKGRL